MSHSTCMLAAVLALMQSGVPDRLAEELATLLVHSPTTSDTPDALAGRLAKLGPAVIPPAFLLLDAGELPGAEPVALDEPQERALILCLSAFGREAVLGELERRWQDPEKPLRNTLAVLGQVGGLRDLERCIEQARTRPLASSAEHRAFEEAAQGMLTRSPADPHRVRRLLLDAPQDLASDLVRALSEQATPRALELYTDLLGLRPSLDRSLLQAIARIGPSLRRPLDERQLETVRHQLDLGDEDLLPAAILAVGSLGDFDAVPVLIEHLAEDSSSASANARWALEQISGRAFGRDPSRWRLWLVSEGNWYHELAPRWLEELRTDDLGRLTRALNELCQRTYRRDELALELCEALDNPDPRARFLICRALERLGSGAAVEGLVPLLEDPDDDVHDAAWRALRSLSGQDLPADPEAWKQYLERW